MMGTVVLDAGPSREGLHIYAHCLRGHPGGVALLAINNSRTATSAARIAGPSERYTISADTLQSKSVKLNGKSLQLRADDELPQMAGVSEPAGRVSFAPATITFLTVSTAGNAQCNAQ
jgi:hypothetical protein